MSQDEPSTEEVEVYDPEPEEDVSEDEIQREINAIGDRIQEDRLDLDPEEVHSSISSSRLADARHNAKRYCLKNDDLSKYIDYLVIEILDMHKFEY